MFDHVGIVFRDLRMASAFYRAVLAPLGIKLMEDHTGADGTGWLVFSTGAPESPFFVVAAGRPSFWADEHEAARSPAHLPSGRRRAPPSMPFTALASRRVRRITAIPA
jgi:catechol 2,3-dioxygenase-like lactoylglutathione lyase family enzyme